MEEISGIPFPRRKCNSPGVYVLRLASPEAASDNIFSTYVSQTTFFQSINHINGTRVLVVETKWFSRNAFLSSGRQVS